MKNWWFSLSMLGLYLVTFQLWLTFPERVAFLVFGALAVGAMSACFREAARRGYFVSRTDRVLHALVIADVALEAVSFEVFDVASRCVFCTPGDPSCFHSNYNFCWCTAILGVLVGSYRAWGLYRGRAAASA